jgi:hypothetical protein
MALEDQVAPEEQTEQPQQGQAPAPENLSDEEEKDLKIAVLLAERMLEDKGYDVIQKALDTSKDPAQVIGQFMLTLIKKLDESMPNDAKLSKRIWLCKGGWLEQVMDMVIDEFQLDYSISDKAEVYVADTASKLAKAGSAQGGAPAPQPGEAPPVIPQGVPA